MKFTPNTEAIPKHFQVGVEAVNIDVAGDAGYQVAVKGWVSGHAGGTGLVRIETTGGTLAMAPIDALRPEVFVAHAQNECLSRADPSVPIGFQLAFSKLLLPPGGTCNLIAEFHSTSGTQSALLGKLSEFVALPDTQLSPCRFAPILIPSMGRSGTTMLAGLLGTHPLITAAGGHPFEYRFASYLWHLAHVSTAPADFRNSMHPDSFETERPFSIGFNPYNSRTFLKFLDVEPCGEWLQTTWVKECMAHARRGVNDFYSLVAEGLGKPDARAFVEKTVVSPLLNVARNIHPDCHEIYLVRDFRDTYCSARHFNQVRGTQSFGRDESEDDTVWLTRLAKDALRVLAHYESRRNDCILVRYEDLLGNMPFELSRLLRHLGLASDEKVVQSMIEAHAQPHPEGHTHRTSSSSTESIGRWRRDMSPKE